MTPWASSAQRVALKELRYKQLSPNIIPAAETPCGSRFPPWQFIASYGVIGCYYWICGDKGGDRIGRFVLEVSSQRS